MRYSGMTLLLLFSISAFEFIRKSGASSWNYQAQPTCAELQSFWEAINRARNAAEITNEISIFPWEMTSFSGNLMSPYWRKNDEINSYQRSIPLQDILPRGSGTTMHRSAVRPSAISPDDYYSVFVPNQVPIASSTPEFLGTFGDFFGPSSELKKDDIKPSTSLGSMEMSDAKRKFGNDKIRSSPWGAPHEVGMFGEFVDLDDLPLAPRNKVKLSEELNSVDESTIIRQKSCSKIENKMCSSDTQCFCSGANSMKCKNGKCNYVVDFEKENAYGTWHNGPLPFTQLGAFRRLRRKSLPSVMM